ncbi:PQ-loop repeat-containing protein 1 [Choanephora cucurbitarum]|uniref:PQ-loop repeat-containing protein 1 n=1 Tax=Choanephora cucurbitarum TaxID=101091 RepID=A0A1C7NPR8_9FUNG|nr:PQ-loop repeat-containing protein 1 [Choanephora cucurbitarum]
MIERHFLVGQLGTIIMGNIASVGLSAAMVIGPVAGYVDQYLLIRRQQSSAGFNAMTCGVLLFAKFGKRFDTTLLLQSIAMVIAMLILLEIVIRYKHDQSYAVLYSDLRRASFSSGSIIEEDLRAEEEGFDLERRHSLRRAWRMPFWGWDHYLDYVNCLLAFTTLVAFSYLMFRNHPAYIEILGILSLGIESTLPLPQCISNFKRRSTTGFSPFVLASWFCGDAFKLFYFIYTGSPLQFIVCGAIQISIDTCIVLECILFSSFVKSRVNKSSWIHQTDDTLLPE